MFSSALTNFRGPAVLDAHSSPVTPNAWIAAAGIVALANAVQVARHLSPALRVSTRILVHLYDFGLFMLFGLIIALVASLVQLVHRRWPATQLAPFVLASWLLLGGALGALVLGLDLGNFIVRHHLRIKPAALGALTGAVTLGLHHGTTLLLRGRWGRHLAVLVGVVVGYTNAEFLVGDYRGIHLFVGLFAILVCGHGLASLHVRRPTAIPVLGATILAAVAAFVPPRDSVRQGLWLSSGSALFPMISDWVAVPRHAPRRRHGVENSVWFEPRNARAAIPPRTSKLVPPRPIVLLITIEALRADVLDRSDLAARLPTLARLRDSSLWFRSARTPSPATVVTTASLLTGKYYSQIYFRTIAPGAVDAARDRSVRLPELLGASGVETSFVVAYRSLQAKYGIARGFAREIKASGNFAPADEVMQLVIDELERNRTTSVAPQFVFAHLLDSHAPYDRAGAKATPFEGYLAELGLVDRELNRLLEYVESSGQKDRVLLVVSADHGEAFGEHGMQFHGKNVYEELLRIPLLFHAPAIRPGRVDEPVTLLDLAPTFLDWFGVATPGSMMGQSLVPLLEGQESALERPIAADAGRRKQAFYFDDGIKVILDLPARTVEVYDLARDPEELRNLIDDPARDFSSYIAAAERFFAVHTLKIPGWKPPWRRS